MDDRGGARMMVQRGFVVVYVNVYVVVLLEAEEDHDIQGVVVVQGLWGLQA